MHNYGYLLFMALFLSTSNLVHAGPHDDAPDRGIIVQRALSSDPALTYFLYVPTQLAAAAPLLVDVHGISRNAGEHIAGFAPFAERYGVVVLAPLFSKERFPDYQRLGRKGRGLRADLALQQMIKEVGQLTGAKTEKVYLFGFSGGAQFVHRYLMAYPKQVASAVIASAGWYKLPDEQRRYPTGIKPNPDLPDIRFDPSQFLTVPACVVVGDLDTRRGSALRKNKKIDKQQGVSRMERGQHWIEAMRAAARNREMNTVYQFHTLPRSGHSFRRSMKHGNMGEIVFDFLFPAAPAMVTGP